MTINNSNKRTNKQLLEKGGLDVVNNLLSCQLKLSQFVYICLIWVIMAVKKIWLVNLYVIVTLGRLVDW
jgi:hypothetical protein